VGLTAVNDSFILESHVFRLLRKHFRSHPHYADLVDLFHEVRMMGLAAISLEHCCGAHMCSVVCRVRNAGHLPD